MVKVFNMHIPDERTFESSDDVKVDLESGALRVYSKGKCIAIFKIWTHVEIDDKISGR